MQDLFGSPECLLASLLIKKEEDRPQLVLLSGHKGVGKTTWCLKLIRLAQERGIKPGGLVSPPVFMQGRKTGIDLLDVFSGEVRRLAYHLEFLPDGKTSLLAAPATGAWRFDAQTFAWGNQVLERSEDSRLFLLDEAGPLEFDCGQGLQPGLKQIDSRRHRLAVVVVRPSLLPRAKARWPWGIVVEAGSCQGGGGVDGLA